MAILLKAFSVTASLLLATGLQAQERTVASLKDLVSAELRSQGFTLPQAMKVHVYAKGAGASGPHRRGDEGLLNAYGWILKADTREVVWTMDGLNSKADGVYRVADHYLDLPAGSYEAYFVNHAMARNSLLVQWERNIDRRRLDDPAPEHGFWKGVAHSFQRGQVRQWRREAGHYGMEVYIPGPRAADVQTFQAPLRWKNTVISLNGLGDSEQRTQGFRLKKATTLHLYAEGEASQRQLVDGAWIQEAGSRKRVWEMSLEKTAYAGGASKNRRQVETIQLPAGDYLAGFASDDSHSPADWNAAPPCDPLLYGLSIAIPNDAERAQFSPLEVKDPEPLAALLKVINNQHRTAPLQLSREQDLRIYALGEGAGRELADRAWIEDNQGKRVWSMDIARTRHAGGGAKNRLAEEVIRLPKGTYTLHYQSDDSHAYGRWNDAAPREPERYGVAVYPVP